MLNRFAEAWRRGSKYQRSLGWRAFSLRVLQVWLWLPKFWKSGSRQSDSIPLDRPYPVVHSEESFELILRRLRRLETSLDSLRAQLVGEVTFGRSEVAQDDGQRPPVVAESALNTTDIAILCRSSGKHCGIAEHSAYLGRRLGINVVGSLADLPDDSQVVFVEYEPSLYQSDEDLLDELAVIAERSMVVLDAHAISYELAMEARWHAIVVTRRNFVPGTLQLSLCLPADSVERPGPPEGIHLGTFGLAFPAKRYEEIIGLARRLNVPATILAAQGDATPEIAELSADYLARIRHLSGGNVTLIDEFLPMEKVIRILSQCSHIVTVMDDNGWQSASLRAMALAGRPLIAVGKGDSAVLGINRVGNVADIDLDFLESCRGIPEVHDGINDYQAFIQRLNRIKALALQIMHNDYIYLSDSRQMERMEWLKERVTGHAIDIGVGNGWSTNFLRATTGAEIRSDRLEYASLRFPHIKFVQLDAKSQALSGYQTLIFSELIEHMPMLEAREMLNRWTMTNPDKILITTPNAGKEEYDVNLVENPEHMWKPTHRTLEQVIPAAYSGHIETTSGGDFLLVELRRHA